MGSTPYPRLICRFTSLTYGKERRNALVGDWTASPILAPSFRDLAPAHIITAEFDLTRDESETYGEILRKNGVLTTMKRYLGVPHAFGHYNVSRPSHAW